MKTEISRDSHQPEKHYSGVYQQQGRMLTDADWNELVDILKDRLSDALTDVVGKGSPLHRNVVNNDSGSTVLHWGTVFVDGIQAEVRAAASATPGAEFDYLHQLDFPQAVGSALPVAPDDNYVYYVDVWERTITHLMDERLRDKGLHGADTCTRKQVMAQVKWCPASIDPETANENPTKGNARLTVSLLPKTTTPDPCDPCAEQLDIETRVGNYLFRVEIHDVIGVANDPTQIKLKWSVENAAELFALKSVLGESVEPPESFKDAPWLYEFFDEDNEKHLGVQLATGFIPERGELVSGYPLSPPERDFVRRWDGYCTLEKTAGVWTVTEQYDRNQSGPGLATFTEINTSELKISLDAQSLILTLDDSFVAGDFWIAEVREIEHDTGSLLLDQALPDGILHHYLKLGEVKAGVLQDNPQADRKYAFPPLTEMTRMFIAGGDGQQAMPSHDLPHPLQVDVANGEWSVTGAQIKYQIETGGGILSKPASLATDHFQLVSDNEAIVISQQGNCSCNWQLGIAGSQRVKATLLGADGIALDHPPVYFNANLSTADQLAYTPNCQGSGVTVHSLLDADNAQVDWPNLDEHGHTTVKNVLDTLLCKLDASKTPYDASQKTDCWQDISSVAADQPDTIQKAIDALVCRSNSNCCNISISPGDNIQAKLSIIKNGQDADICFNKGEYQVVQSILLTNKGHITVTGRGNSTRILASNSESVFILSDCKSVAVRDIAMQSGKEGKTGSNKNLNGTLDINNVNSVTVDHVNLTCPTANGERSASCLTVSYTNPPDKKASVRVCHSKLNPGHHQVGLLLVNGVRAQIEDNEIRVRQKSKNWVLKDRLKVDKFRHTFRSILISNISLAQNSEVSGKKRNASITHEGTTVHFATDPELVTQWEEYVAKNPPVRDIDKQGLINYLNDVADRVLLRKIKNVPQFDSWYMRMESSLPAIASQGIVCAGRAVTDLRIMNNSVYGTAQGIHVGLSFHDPDHPYTAYLAERVQIKGNRIVVSLSSENIAERHGIFVGNCDSLDIESNYVKVERYPEKNKRKIEGIRVYGQLGKMILLRNNHVIGFTTGVFARVTNTNTNIRHLWKVSSNMLEGAFIRVDVAPENQFILEHNS